MFEGKHPDPRITTDFFLMQPHHILSRQVKLLGLTKNKTFFTLK